MMRWLRVAFAGAIWIVTEPSTSRAVPQRISPPEPSRTIYGEMWTAAQRALARPPADATAREVESLRDLAMRVDLGWVFVRPILLYAQDLGERPDADPVFHFSVETAELYRELAGIAFAWIAGAMPIAARDTDSMVSELDRFATHVAVLEMASRGDTDPLSAVLHQMAREVPPWCEAITATVTALADLWDTVEPGDDDKPAS